MVISICKYRRQVDALSALSQHGTNRCWGKVDVGEKYKLHISAAWISATWCISQREVDGDNDARPQTIPNPSLWCSQRYLCNACSYSKHRILLKFCMSKCTMLLRTRRGPSESLKVFEIGHEHLAPSAGSL